MVSRLVLVALLTVLTTSSQLAAGEHTKDSLDKVKENLAAKKAVLVDVREQKEWDKGHLADAQILSLSDLKRVSGDATLTANLATKLPKDRIVYCHCAKGVRALMAGDILEKLGYDVRPLSAGYDDLRAAGFAIAPPDSAAKP
jgi:phage shock protein E